MKYADRLKPKVSAVKRHLSAKKRAAVSSAENSRLYNLMEDLIYKVKNKYSLLEKYSIQKDGLFEKTSDFAVILHLYYTDNWSMLFEAKLKRLSSKINFDLYVTMPESNKDYIPVIRKHFKRANVLIVPNRGRDVLPFIKTAILLDEMGYKKVLKIHSKKSMHRELEGNTAESGGNWLNNTLNSLIPDDDKILDDVVLRLKDQATGMVGALEYYYPLKMYLSHNLTLVKRIMNAIDPDFFSGTVSIRLDKLGFFGGTMFWADISAIREALFVSKTNFQKEHGQTDGTMAHALERVFCILPQIKHKSIYGVSAKGVARVQSGVFPDWYFDDMSGGRPRISVAVPVYADWDSLSKNISSLIKHVGNSEEVSVHYVNDCGPDAGMLESKIVEKISPLTNFYYYRNDKNLGFVKTCNKAALELTPQKDDVLLLNSDTKVTKDFAITMKRCLYSADNIGAVTARSNNATVWSVPMNGRLANHRILSYMLYLLIKGKIPEKYITPTIHGFCVLIRREVIGKYKLFDEVYGKGYGEENDFAMRIRSHGWKCAVANGAFVFHYESRSFGNDERKKQIEKNEKILLKRYPDYRSTVQEYWDSIEEPLK